MATTILVVDRDINRRSLVSTHFAESPGVAVLSAGEGVETLRSVRISAPSLIFLGVDNWQEDTPWMLLALRTVVPAVPIIAYSERYDMEVTRKALASGAHDLLPADAKRQRYLDAATHVLHPTSESRVA